MGYSPRWIHLSKDPKHHHIAVDQRVIWVLKLILAGERPPSYNQFLHFHWHKANTENQRVKQLVWLESLAQKLHKVEVYPVFITYHVYFDKRPLDATNVVVKFYEDGLKECGILENDDPKHVRGYAIYVYRGDPRIEIEIE